MGIQGKLWCHWATCLVSCCPCQMSGVYQFCAIFRTLLLTVWREFKPLEYAVLQITSAWTAISIHIWDQTALVHHCQEQNNFRPSVYQLSIVILGFNFSIWFASCRVRIQNSNSLPPLHCLSNVKSLEFKVCTVIAHQVLHLRSCKLIRNVAKFRRLFPSLPVFPKHITPSYWSMTTECNCIKE